MSAYQAATASQPGSIAIGSRTYTIVAGAQLGSGVTLVAGMGNRCIGGTVDASGRFTAITSANPYGAVGPSNVVTFTICGTVADYRPATATTAGFLVFQLDGRETIVPQGTVLPLAPGASPGNRCFAGRLSAAGDAIVIGTLVAEATSPPVAATPGTVATLPSTAAGESAPSMALIGLVAAAVFVAATLGLWSQRRRS